MNHKHRSNDQTGNLVLAPPKRTTPPGHSTEQPPCFDVIVQSFRHFFDINFIFTFCQAVSLDN